MSGEPAGSWVQCRVYFYGDKVLCLVCVVPFTFVSPFLSLLSLSLAGGNVGALRLVIGTGCGVDNDSSSGVGGADS